MKRNSGLNQLAIVAILLAILLASVGIVYWSQFLVERDAFTGASSSKEQYEIAKLAAEIRQIRSDTSGSLFWLKMIALFVTVGGAVGGYLIGQSSATRARIDFEDRRNVDAAYQAIVQELSNESPLLRAAAVVKLGMILRSFPREWVVADSRRDQLIDLTKQVLAASLSIETEAKILKTLTSAIALHHPWENAADSEPRKRYADLRQIDLSGAKGHDAYWARVDLTYADLYKADMKESSFRGAILRSTQFREANLTDAVLINADCESANFKLADLRRADLTGANVSKANFDGTKVYGAVLKDLKFSENPAARVDISISGDGSKMVPVGDWLASAK